MNIFKHHHFHEKISWNWVHEIFQRVLDDHQYRFFVKNSSTFLSGSLQAVHSHFRNNLGRNILAQDLRKLRFRSNSDESSNWSLEWRPPHLELPHSSYGTILMVVVNIYLFGTPTIIALDLVLNKYSTKPTCFFCGRQPKDLKKRKIKFAIILGAKIRRKENSDFW